MFKTVVSLEKRPMWIYAVETISISFYCLKWLWNGYEMVMKWLWDGYEMVMKWLWNGYEMVMNWLGNGYELIMKWLWNGYEMVMKWLWNGYEMVMKWLWNGYEMVMNWPLLKWKIAESYVACTVLSQTKTCISNLFTLFSFKMVLFELLIDIKRDICSKTWGLL